MEEDEKQKRTAKDRKMHSKDYIRKVQRTTGEKRRNPRQELDL